MNLFFDTNIILTVIRAKNYYGILKYLNPDNAPVYVSVALEAEIKSIALLNSWGINRREKLDNFLDRINIVEINQLYINTYIEIDAYSLHRNPAFINYPFDTA